MESINGCCCGCDTQQLNKTKEICPVCHNDGISVNRVTIEHLLKDNYRDDVDVDKYKICTDEDCDVVYYSIDSGKKFLRNQIRVPIWYKKEADPKYAC